VSRNPSACPLGSCCTGPIGDGFNGFGGFGGFGYGNGNGFESGRFSCCTCAAGGNGLGSIVTIPTQAIAAFVNNAIG